MYYEYIDIIPLQLGNQSICCPFKNPLSTIGVTFLENNYTFSFTIKS
jgi:hypothetical protein